MAGKRLKKRCQEYLLVLVNEYGFAFFDQIAEERT